LNVDPTGICAQQIAYKLLVWRGIFEGIFFDNFKESFDLRFQS